MSEARDKLVTAMMQRMVNVRPFAPGESVDNADGSYSTERTRTVPLARGWANVPSLYMGPSGPVDFEPMDDDWLAALATALEQRGTAAFGRHRTLSGAVGAARRRSEAGGAGSGYKP